MTHEHGTRSTRGTAGVTESQLQTAVIQLARTLGWRVAHFRPGMTQRGNWVTAVQGDGAGFPDLIMVKPGSELTVYAVELKAAKGKVSARQRDWLDWLDEAGCFTEVWTPADWLSGHIEVRLRADEKKAAA